MQVGRNSRVTTESVLDSAKAMTVEEWTTFDLARHMRVHECPVRAAVSWLVTRQVFEVAGFRKGFYVTCSRRKTYKSNTYRIKPGMGEVDFHTLNMAFVYGR